jgi:hypothetical protein
MGVQIKRAGQADRRRRRLIRSGRRGFRPWQRQANTTRRRLVRSGRRLFVYPQSRAARKLVEFPYRRRRGQLRRQGVTGSLYFAPDQPHAAYLMWKVTEYLGLEVVGAPRSDTVGSVLWRDATTISEAAARNAMEPGMLNAKCLDISKSRVERAMQAVFGYGLAVDPLTHDGPVVRKSEANRKHDGQLIVCLTEPEPRFVYQRLVDNRVGDMAEDCRLTVVGDTIPLSRVVYRPLDDRFRGFKAARRCRPEEMFTRDELNRLLAVCADIGLDFGELDVLRDRQSGRIYVVDVANTPYGPREGLSNEAIREYVHSTAIAFCELFPGFASGLPTQPGWGWLSAWPWWRYSPRKSLRRPLS